MKKLLSALTLLCVLLGCSSCIFYVPTAGISLSENSISGVVNDSVMLSPTIYPSNATNQSVSWSSDNPSVASVSSIGLVTLHDIGEAIITAEAADGQKAYCYVVVQEECITVPITIENWRQYLSLSVRKEGGLAFYLSPNAEYDNAVFSNVSLTIEGTILYDLVGSTNSKSFTHQQHLKSGWVRITGSIRYYNYEITNATGSVSYYIEH